MARSKNSTCHTLFDIEIAHARKLAFYPKNDTINTDMEMLLPLTIKTMIDKKSGDAPFIAYTPELDVSSCGPTEEKARKNLMEAVSIVLEEIQEKGKLAEFLEESGFQKQNKQWKPPRVSFEPFFFSFAAK